MLTKAAPHEAVRPTQAAWDVFAQAQLDALAELARLLTSGEIGAEEWADRFDALLLEGHTAARQIGRNLAGDLRPRIPLDEILGRGRKDGEAHWLNRFLDDIVEGRYTDDEGMLSEAAIRARSQMYAGKMRATASMAWVDTGPSGILYHWVLVAEEHCDDCPRIAVLSPFTEATLFTHPGDGDTQCLSSCLCFLRRDDGQEMFQRYPRAA